MPDDALDLKKAQAILIATSVLSRGDRGDVLRRTSAGIFGLKPGEGGVVVSDGLIEGRHFVRRSHDSPTYRFPTGHTLAGTDRYEWHDLPGDDGQPRPGISVGVPLPDPEAEPGNGTR